MIPQLEIKEWDGDSEERLTPREMMRIEYNANILAKYAGVIQVDYTPITRSSPFDYRECSLLERQISAVGDKLGLSFFSETNWGPNRTFSYVDVDRWELNTYRCYKAMGGVGNRIPSDRSLHIMSAMLIAENWIPTSNLYYQDLDVPPLDPDKDLLAYVSESATVSQRGGEYNSILQAQVLTPRRIRVHALRRPELNIPIRLTTRMLPMIKQITLNSGSWSGSGPWTQNVTVTNPPQAAIVGSDNRNSVDQVLEYARCIIGVSGVSGNTITVRAIGHKPTMNLYASIFYDDSVTVTE